MYNFKLIEISETWAVQEADLHLRSVVNERPPTSNSIQHRAREIETNRSASDATAQSAEIETKKSDENLGETPRMSSHPTNTKLIQSAFTV